MHRILTATYKQHCDIGLYCEPSLCVPPGLRWSVHIRRSLSYSMSGKAIPSVGYDYHMTLLVGVKQSHVLNR